MVLGILGIGVNLGLGLQHKTRRLGHVDDFGRRDIAVAGIANLRPRVSAVVLDRQDAARLQHGVEILHAFFGKAGCPHPVMDVAGGDHQVGGIGGAQRPRLLAEHGVMDGAICSRVGELVRQLLIGTAGGGLPANRGVRRASRAAGRVVGPWRWPCAGRAGARR